MDNTKRFNGRAADYTSGRPGYSEQLISFMFKECGVSSRSFIADIGSGTGKFARQLLDKGSTIYCVEPNDDMRNTAESELSGYENFRSVKGGAEDTTLAAASVDHITTAQAFHWFDVKKFRQECSRIIKPDGKVFLIWNVRDMDSPLNKELFEIYSKYCSDFRGFSGGIKRDDPRIAEFFENKYERVSFVEPLYLDKEKYIARCLSGSYALKEGDKFYPEQMQALEVAFSKYSQNGIITIANCSVAYFGSIK